MKERENEIAAEERRLGELKEMREKRKWKNGREENVTEGRRENSVKRVIERGRMLVSCTRKLTHSLSDSGGRKKPKEN